MRRSLILAAALMLTGCGMMDAMMNQAAANKKISDAKGGDDKAKGENRKISTRDVGRGTEIPAEKTPYKNNIQKVLGQFRRPGLKMTTEFPVAWYGTSAAMNGYALKSGSKAMVYAKANVYGTYLEIYAFDPRMQTNQDKPWVEKGAGYYKKATKGDKTRYAVNGNYLIYFEDNGPENERFINLFQKTKLR